MSEDTSTVQGENGSETFDFAAFFSDILKPGSSLHPAFLLILDVVLAVLLLVFILLFFITKSFHMVALMVIEICLWLSVKWFVAELRRAPPALGDTPSTLNEDEKLEGKKDR